MLCRSLVSSSKEASADPLAGKGAGHTSRASHGICIQIDSRLTARASKSGSRSHARKVVVKRVLYDASIILDTRELRILIDDRISD